MRFILLLALAFVALPAAAQPLEDRVLAVLRSQGAGTRFGIVVAGGDGREVLAINADDRFVPASNTKMFTTAAVFDTLFNLDRPDDAGGTALQMEGEDVVLDGRGDARLSSAPDCARDCLVTLADAVMRERRQVRDVIGDDSLFADERWSPGMSWNNIPTASGTGISALSIDDNEARLIVTPAAMPGAPPMVAGDGYFTIENRATTVAAGQPAVLGIDRLPMERRVRLSGTVAVGAEPRTLRLGIDDPAHYAAWRLAELLRRGGVRVTGTIRVRHREPAAPGPSRADLTRLSAPPLIDVLRMTNKDSQNLYAELLLRRVGLSKGVGSLAGGLTAIDTVMAKAGVPRWSYDFADGSGMSSYNRVTPRAALALLRWTVTQPWGAAWRATLPIGGIDGTLARRFKGTPLEGRIFAKTGSLDKANALAGFMTAASGATLTFAIYAADMPQSASATKTIDAALNVIAAGL
jgi:D-alanyl-D-alanine carboxypeptidase/D-alanyl-D-alanine-endopeptidase (penicillin-binding protein 4)